MYVTSCRVRDKHVELCGARAPFLVAGRRAAAPLEGSQCIDGDGSRWSVTRDRSKDIESIKHDGVAQRFATPRRKTDEYIPALPKRFHCLLLLRLQCRKTARETKDATLHFDFAIIRPESCMGGKRSHVEGCSVFGRTETGVSYDCPGHASIY